MGISSSITPKRVLICDREADSITSLACWSVVKAAGSESYNTPIAQHLISVSYINTCWTISRWQGLDDCLLVALVGIGNSSVDFESLAPGTRSYLCMYIPSGAILIRSESQDRSPCGHLQVYCFHDLLSLLKTYRFGSGSNRDAARKPKKDAE